jgi:hypothetical protein
LSHSRLRQQPLDGGGDVKRGVTVVAGIAVLGVPTGVATGIGCPGIVPSKELKYGVAKVELATGIVDAPRMESVSGLRSDEYPDS